MVRDSGRSRGCEPCRRRRRKCDETQPRCVQCLQRGRECPGPLQGLIVFEAEHKNPTKFRLVSDKPPIRRPSDADVKPFMSPDNDKILDSAAVDPFSSTVVPLTPHTNSHYQHFMLHTVNCCWPFRPEMLGVWCGEQATKEPTILYGVLSMSASHRFYLDRTHMTNSSDANRWMVQALEFRAKLIDSIQETVNEIGVSNLELAAVMIAFLICIEASNTNIKEMDVHMAGLQQLIQYAGGLDTFDLPTISFLMGVDILWAIVKCAAPTLPAVPKYLAYALDHPTLTIYSSNSLEKDLVDSSGGHMFQEIGSRFIRSPWASVLDRSLRVTIRNFCNLIIHYEADNLRPYREKIVAFNDNNPWNVSQLYLLTLSYEHLGNRDIREPLRRSMLAYSMTRYCKFGAFPCMDAIASTLRESLIPRLEVFHSTAPDLLFWILYAGALTARPISEHYRWYCTHIAGVSTILGLRDWSDVQSLLEQFFYVHRPSDRSAEKVWQDTLS